MNTCQRTSGCRVISITSARPARAPHSHSVLALIGGQHTMNLAELAQSIQADCNLCYLVTEAACQEFGWPWLSVEDAVVLLGRERLCALLSNPGWHRRSARQLRRALHRNHPTPAAQLRLLETSQGGTE